MKKIDPLEHVYSFQTERLSIQSWSLLSSNSSGEYSFAEKIVKILTPSATKYLPDNWQCISNVEEAETWIQNRLNEAKLLTVKLLSSGEISGIVILHELALQEGENIDIHLGYILGESFWGKGLGNEVVNGFIQYCISLNYINSIIAGVAKSNIPSIKILEKNGFQLQNSVNLSKTETFMKYSIQ